MAAFLSQMFVIGLVAYWDDPRIHNMGNGRLHAFLARPATRLIDRLAYGGRDVRKEVLAQYVQQGDRVVDLCCGTGTSTMIGGVGVDTSEAMIREAKWRRGPTQRFEVGNAETWGDDAACDTVTLFFALHEMPAEGRRRVLENAMRIATSRVVVCDISPRKVASDIMLSGEPYLLEYQKNIVRELEGIGDRVFLDEVVPRRVLVGVVSVP